MKRLAPIVIALLLFSCQAPQKQRAIKILATESFRSVLPEINNRYRALYKTDVEVEYATCPELEKKLQDRKETTILLTDDNESLTRLNAAGVFEKYSRQLMNGVLTGWTLKNIAFDDSLNFLRSTAIGQIGIADPEHCVIGKAAEVVLLEIDAPASVYKKIKNYPSINEAILALEKGEADFIFANKSIVLSPSYTGQGYWFEIPSSFYTPLEHFAFFFEGKSSTLRKEANAYYNFLTSIEASQVYEKFGFEQEEAPLEAAFPFHNP